MRIDRTKICSICLLLLVCSSATALVDAQTHTFSASLHKADIDVSVGKTTTVRSLYQFQVQSTDETTENPNISGSISVFPKSNINNISAIVNNQKIKPEIKRRSRVVQLAVPIPNTTTNDRISVKVRYNVTQKGTQKRIPLWVPQYTTKTQNNINMSITLPSGTHPQGDVFPRPKAVSGNHMKSTTEFVPGFIMVGYGETTETGLTLDTILSIVGLILIVVLIGVGTLYEYRGRQNRQVEGE